MESARRQTSTRSSWTGGEERRRKCGERESENGVRSSCGHETSSRAVRVRSNTGGAPVVKVGVVCVCVWGGGGGGGERRFEQQAVEECSKGIGGERRVSTPPKERRQSAAQDSSRRDIFRSRKTPFSTLKPTHRGTLEACRQGRGLSALTSRTAAHTCLCLSSLSFALVQGELRMGRKRTKKSPTRTQSAQKNARNKAHSRTHVWTSLLRWSCLAFPLVHTTAEVKEKSARGSASTLRVK